MYNNGNSSKNVTGASVVDGTIANADIDSSAAIAQSKLATLVITDSEVADNELSGDKIDSGTIGNLTSLGVGVEPSYKLEINSGTSNNVALFESTDSNAHILIKDDNTTANDSIRVSAQGDNLHLTAKETDGVIIFNPENAERARVTADGLTFNGDTAAANALDDYEEGTFTATLTAVTPPTNPPTTTGTYTKIGNKVHFNINRFDNVDTTGASGQMKITGLPFTLQKEAVMTDVSLYKFSFNTSRSQYFRFSGGDTMSAYESTSNTSWQAWSITAGTGRYLTVQGTYEAS